MHRTALAALGTCLAAVAIAQTAPARTAAAQTPASPAPAAPAPAAPAATPTRVRGTIVSLAAPILSVATREGPTVAVTLSDSLSVSALKRVELGSIAPGAYVGVAARPAPDGTLRAIEVLVFPEAARGTGEGHYDWDLSPGTSMTNATVTAAVAGTSGRDLHLSYKGSAVTVQVPPDAPVVTPVPAERADLKPGAAVFVIATRAPNGDLASSRLFVGKDGVDPPM